DDQAGGDRGRRRGRFPGQFAAPQLAAVVGPDRGEVPADVFAVGTCRHVEDTGVAHRVHVAAGHHRCADVDLVLALVPQQVLGHRVDGGDTEVTRDVKGPAVRGCGVRRDQLPAFTVHKPRTP